MEFAKFKQDYGFDHLTSSPRFPQSNGEAERAVQTVKNLLEKDDDPYVALLVYRTTPLQIGFSPAELLMSRKLRTTIPTTKESRKPQIPNEKIIRERDENSKKRQKYNFDTHHGVRPLQTMNPGTKVWIADRDSEAIVVNRSDSRSYRVELEDGMYRRNRRHLIMLPEDQPEQEEQESVDQSSRNAQSEVTHSQSCHTSNQPSTGDCHTRTRSGRASIPPSRLEPNWK